MRGGGFGVEGVREVLEIVAIAILDQESGSIEQFRVRIQSYQMCWIGLGDAVKNNEFSIRYLTDWLDVCGKSRVTYSQDDFHFTT